jgi:hypothetical protein
VGYCEGGIMPDESNQSRPIESTQPHAASGHPTTDAAPLKPVRRSRKALRAMIAGVSFAFGLIVGPYAEELLTRANPEFFGPDNQQIIEDQRGNFARLDSKLAELRHANADDPQTQAMIHELAGLIEEQKALAARKDQMFKATDVERQRLGEQLLRRQGSSTAVGFWLKVGESIVLKDPGNVLAIAIAHSNLDAVTVNLSGEQTRMTVGDILRFNTTEGPYAVIYRHAARESDGRYGFDLTKADAASP